MPRRADRLAEELHTALHNAGIDGPYFLVGLAFGSLPARAFADRWMPEVSGLVLINPDAPDVEAPEMAGYWQRLIARQVPPLRRCRDMVAAGKPTPLTPPADDPHLNCYAHFFRGLPDTQFSPELNAALQDEIGKRLPVWDALLSELEEIPDDEAYLKEHRTSFGSRPLRIITANFFHDTENTPSATRLEHMRVSYYESLAQATLLNLSSNAKQIFSNTGIVVYFEKPELVVQTIREAWEQSK